MVGGRRPDQRGYLFVEPFPDLSVERLVERAVEFEEAVGTWNARGEALWANSPGKWIAADVTLEQEQGESYPVDVLLARWRVAEGHVAAVWAGSRAELFTIMGFHDEPELPHETAVWYGE